MAASSQTLPHGRGSEPRASASGPVHPSYKVQADFFYADLAVRLKRVPIRIGVDLVPSPLARFEGIKRDQVRAWLLQNWSDSMTFEDSRHSARVRAVHT